MPTNLESPQPVRRPKVERRFLTFLVGVTLADLADRGWLVVLAFTAASLSSPLQAALLVAAGTVPRAVLVLIGGAFADRLPSRPLLVTADLFRAAVLVAGALLLASAAVPVAPLVLVIGVLFGVADAIHLPVVGTMPRQLIPADGLVRAAGLRQMVGRIAYLAGPPLAGLALASLALQHTLALLVVPLVLAGVAQAYVRPRFARPAAARQSVPAAVSDLIAHLRERPTTRALVLSLIGLNFFVIPVTTLGVALRVSAEHWGAARLGLLLGLIGVGAVVGTLISLRVHLRFPLRLAYGMLTLQGLALTVIGFAPQWGVGVALATVGLTSGLACPALAGMLQARIEPAYLGRVYSLVSLSDDGLLPLALAGFGAVAVAIGVNWTVAICGLGMMAWMGSALFRPALRDLTEVDGVVLPCASAPVAADPVLPARMRPADPSAPPPEPAAPRRTLHAA